MNAIDPITQFVMNTPIYVLNGFLWVVYWLAGNMPALVSIGMAFVLIFTADRMVQQTAASRPLRNGRGEVEISLSTPQLLTLFTLVLWLIAQWGMGAPVPWIGGAMWLCGVSAILALPAQRFGMMNMTKSAIAMYALAVIGFRIAMSYMTQITPDQWVGLLGTAETASQIIRQTQGNVSTIIVWAVWFVLPLGYFAMLIQQIFINPVSLVNPYASFLEMTTAIRDRGGR